MHTRHSISRAKGSVTFNNLAEELVCTGLQCATPFTVGASTP